jgi:putative ABC transport system substrate-binding protein
MTTSPIRRRDCITLFGGAALVANAWPRPAPAQQGGRMRRIGVLRAFAETDLELNARMRVVLQELQKLGWTEGRNVRFDNRWSAADLDRLRANAVELIGLSPDVILSSSNQATTILSQLTRTIPIVFINAGDPVGTGLIENMARPGGNVTGFAGYESELAGKWLQLLKEVAPNISRVAAVYTPEGPASLATLRVIENLAASLNVQPISFPAQSPAEIERSIDAFAREPNGALITLGGPATSSNRALIISLAAKHRLPAIYGGRIYIASGGLMSYTAVRSDQYRLAASYVDRILRGEKPGDLPVQAPTKYELIVNLKAAKAIGLSIPESFPLRADEVIE